MKETLNIIKQKKKLINLSNSTSQEVIKVREITYLAAPRFLKKYKFEILE